MTPGYEEGLGLETAPEAYCSVWDYGFAQGGLAQRWALTHYYDAVSLGFLTT